MYINSHINRQGARIVPPADLLILMQLIIISPNEVVGDIMVLASPPRLPVDPDDVNTLSRRFHVSANANVIRKCNHHPTLSVIMSSVFPLGVEGVPGYLVTVRVSPLPG